MRAFNSNFREAVCPGAQGRRSGGGGGRKDASCPHPSHRNSSGHAFYSGNRKRNSFMHAHTEQSYCTLMHAHTDCKILPYAIKKCLAYQVKSDTYSQLCAHAPQELTRSSTPPARTHTHTQARSHVHTHTYTHTFTTTTHTQASKLTSAEAGTPTKSSAKSKLSSVIKWMRYVHVCEREIA